MTSPTIPKEEQLQALADGLQALYQLISRYIGGPIRTDFRKFVTVTKDELTEYLRQHPSLAQKHILPPSQAERLHDHPVLIEENGRWIVCWIDHGARRNEMYFDDLPAAAARFLMAYW